MTAFQWVFDNAASISMNKRPIVGRTVTRNQTVRATSRGGEIWRFDVTMPNGQLWSTARPYIAEMEALDRHTASDVQLNNSGYASWLSAYQGDSANDVGFTASWTTGNTITMTGYPTGHGMTSGDVLFKAGDFIQLGSTNSVYEVADDATYSGSSETVTLNRPILESASSATLQVGDNVTWSVICMNFPNWTIIDRDIVAFDGPFTFYEALV